MNQVDIQGTASDILKAATYHGTLGEILMIMAEIHEHHSQQDEASQGQRNDGPCHTKGMPLQGIQGRKDNQYNHNGIEPAAVHDTLGPIPITAHHIAIKEEGEIHEQLVNAGSVHKLAGGASPSKSP